MDEKTLNALVNAIKNKDPKGLKAYENLLKIASSKPKNEEEQKNIEAAKGYVAEIKKRLATKAAHGAKLDYIKSLKHICPEGEELVYFKQGGSVKCGCIGKKLEEGAKVEKASTGAVAKFKKKGESVARKITDTIAIITGTKSGVDKAREVKEKELHNTVGDGTSKSHRFDVNKPKFKNDYSSKRVKDSEKDYLEGRGDHLYKNGSKLKSAGCSCAVKKFKAKCGSKIKKHQLGGSLNGIPFYLGGGLPTAPKAEKRFRKNSYNTTKEGNRETTTITSQTPGYNRNWPYFRQPATILRIIEGGDTAFVETPEHHIFTKVLPRTALKSGNVYVEYNPKYDKNYSLHGQANTMFNYPINPLEYKILKGRFDKALGK